MPEANAQMPVRHDEVVEIDLRDALRVIVRNRFLLAGMVCASVAAALVYICLVQPVYRAQSRILVDRKPPKIVKVEDVVLADYTDQTNFYNSQVEILKSRTLAGMVFKELGTYEPPHRRGKPAGELKAITDAQRVDALLEHLKISPVRMTQIIDVSAEDPDPELAARIANTWAQAYVLFSSVEQLIQRRTELQTELSQREKYLKANHPVILGMQNELKGIEDKIAQEQTGLRRSGAPEPEASSGGETITNVRILDQARVPRKPVRPQKMLAFALALMLGLFSGGLLVVIREALDQTMKNAADLERTIGMSPIVSIPRFKNINVSAGVIPELVSQKSPQSLVAESFRHLRTRIIYSVAERPPRTILVTSSSAAEGKTTAAVNMAAVFAQAGERTLLVDADMRSPRMHKIFNIGFPDGLTDILVYDRENIQTSICKTTVPNLDVLACGEIPSNPSELLGSKNMQSFIARALRQYERVIFDSPPLLAATDAAVLSATADATVLVVRAGFVQRQAVLSGLQALQTVNARVLAAVLNMVDFYGDGSHYHGYSLYEPNTRRKHTARSRKRAPLVVQIKKK